MLGAFLSLTRSVLWSVNIALTIIVMAVLVAPVSTAANMAGWLSVVGLSKQAEWLIVHANTGLHLSAHSLVPAASTSCNRFVCTSLSSAFEVTLSLIALPAIAGIAACSVVLWLLPRFGRMVQAVKTDWFHDNMAHHNPL